MANANRAAESSSSLTCGGRAPRVVSLPVEQIERAIRPTDAQVAMLNDLEAASAEADNSCELHARLKFTPLARLDAVAKRIEAMIEAVRVLRPDNEQKDRLAAIGMEAKCRRTKAGGGESAATNLGGLCKQQTENFTQMPVQRIAQLIKPTEEQNGAFDVLKAASTKAAAELDASCPSKIPETLTDRIDAAAKRLDALVQLRSTSGNRRWPISIIP
jgi:hypothetical protein